jgi:RNA polymerase sigma-70 factor (ECF subfamily)
MIACVIDSPRVIDPDVRTLDDEALARRIMRGRAQREESELCLRFAPRVRLYGRRHLGSNHAADDLVQRVLAVTIDKLRAGKVEKPEKIASFVLGTARMISREIVRERREEPLPPDVVDQLPARESISGEPMARERLARCLETLTERARAVVLLTFFHEQEPEEIAAALSVSKGNVRVIRHRAIDSLRECMGLTKEVIA